MSILILRSSASGSLTAEQDWVNRSTAAGVLWNHNFDTQTEVDNFRWLSTYALAPNVATATAAGFPIASRVAWNSSDGFAGGGSLEIQVPIGGNTDGAKWWRPMSALNSSGNGKASSDLAANGTTQLRTWTPTQNTDPGFSWQKGYFGNSTEQSLTGSTYAGNSNVWDGTDFYFQVRVKISASRFNTANPQGKLIYLDIMGTSGEQEVLVRSNTKQSWNVSTGNFDIYTSFGNYLQSYLGNPQGDSSNTTQRQPGSATASTCLFDTGVVQTGCWEWPADTWVTLLVHVIPGQDSYRTSGYDGGDQATWATAPHDAGLEVWVAAEGVTSYTKIWDKQDYVWQYDTARNPAGFNGVVMSAYINGENAVEAYTQRYTQMILSKSFIPCPLA